MQLLIHYVLAVLYVILATGLSSNLFSRFFQITGILASLVSISKACSEWHVYTGYNMNFEKKQVSPNFLTIVKAAFFFAPHIVFRTTSIYASSLLSSLLAVDNCVHSTDSKVVIVLDVFRQIQSSFKLLGE